MSLCCSLEQPLSFFHSFIYIYPPISFIYYTHLTICAIDFCDLDACFIHCIGWGSYIKEIFGLVE